MPPDWGLGLIMAFADFSSSDLKKQALPGELFDIHANTRDGGTTNDPDTSGYRLRLAFLLAASLVLWGAIYEAARVLI
jgi:hypothetical protein